jgi:signal transduction histidine kinase
MFTRALQFARHGVGRHPLLIDTLLGGTLAAPALIIAMTPDPPVGPMGPGSVGVSLFAWAAVACRRWWPLPVLVVTGLTTVALTLWNGSQQPELVISLAVVVYTVASRLDRTRIGVMATAVALPLYAATVVTSSSSWWAPQNIGSLAWIGMAAAAGDATRSRLAYVAEVEERARRAEQDRDQEARRRVVEERLRIARELHDVVSHHIAVINVQAGAARHVLRQQPQAADSALEHIRYASDTVLRELGSIVGVLRQPDEPDSTEPTRGLARIGKLLDASTAAGLKVEHHQQGQTRQLPAVADLAAYRILQEALTNAQKHGAGTACVTIEYTAGHVSVEVTNHVGTPGITSGYGLLGMRERASAAGGTLQAGPSPDGRFRVRAVLPAPATKEQP